MSRRNQTTRSQHSQNATAKAEKRPTQAATGMNSSASAATLQKSANEAALSDRISQAISGRVESSDPVQSIGAIEAAVEILTSAGHESARVTNTVTTSNPGSAADQSASEASASDSNPISSAPTAKGKAAENREPAEKADAGGKQSPLGQILGAFRGGLTDLKTSLREELRKSVADLQAAQSAAAASQSEVLRTLTEVMFQSAGSRDISNATLETALNGLEDRLLARLSEGRSAQAANSSAGNSNTANSSGKPGHSITTVKLKEAAGVVSQSWEQIRSEMISGGDLKSPEQLEASASRQLPELTQLTSDRHFRLPEQDLELEVPKAIDPETLELEQLRDAFREREAFVSTLIARIRRQQEASVAMLSEEQLKVLVGELPEELAERVRHTLKQMEDLARMGELELSLERARVARQVNQLQHTRQILEHNARQLGLSLNEDGTIAVSKTPVTRSSSSRRWLGKLGFGQ